PFHGPRRWISSVLNNPITVSASALSYESPVLPTDGSMPAWANRSVYRIDKYCTPRSLSMHQRLRLDHGAIVERLLQRIEGQVGAQRGRRPPADDPTREHVDD